MSALLETVELALREAGAVGAAASDALLAQSDSLETRVRGDEIDFVKQARESTLGLRSFVRGARGLRSAIVSTSDLRPETVTRMARESVALARATAEDPVAGLTEDALAQELPDLELFDPADEPTDVEGRIEQARSAERAARAHDPRITNSEGSQASSSFFRVAYGSSAGFLGEYRSAHHALFCEPIAQENGSLQRDHWMSVGRRLASLEDADAVGRRAAARALRRLGARRVPTTEVPVIFDSLTARSLLVNLATCVNGYAVYRESSFLGGRLGEQIGEASLTLIDDGRRPGGLGSKPFDGEGTHTRRTPVIEQGRLASYLLDGYSARKLGLASTGNAARSPGSAPAAGPTNLWLEPGSATLEEIIADTPRGLLVSELIGFGFNPVTGDYSRGAAGFWIEQGRIAHPVEEITIAGNLGQMLRQVDAVGSELLWLGSVASPPLRIARMTVAGS